MEELKKCWEIKRNRIIMKERYWIRHKVRGQRYAGDDYQTWEREFSMEKLEYLNTV